MSSNYILYAITIRQPWSWSFFHADPPKPVENRKWKPRLESSLHLFGKRIAIHAGDTYDHEGAEWLANHAGKPVPGPSELPRMAFVGTVLFARVVRKHDSPYFFGPYGHVYEQARAIKPVMWPGKLSYWRVPEVPASQIIGQLTPEEVSQLGRKPDANLFPTDEVRIG